MYQDLSGLSSNAYIMLMITLALLVTLYLLLLGLSHVWLRKDIPPKRRLFWTASFCLVVPVYIYCFFYIRSLPVRVLSIIIPLVLLANGFVLYQSSTYDNLLDDQPINVVTIEEPHMLEPGMLPSAHEDLHQLIIRAEVAHKICEFRKDLFFSFATGAEMFLYEDVAYLLENTGFSFEEATKLINRLREAIKLQYTPPSGQTRAFCSSRLVHTLEDFFVAFAQDPDQVKKDLGVRIP